jgi:amidophosphoribosyltransferase
VEAAQDFLNQRKKNYILEIEITEDSLQEVLSVKIRRKK